ncbi:hypothetical protein HN499_05845 [archaeon]|jgi:hypothetical protein|nr:hypothetical protein [archaeon]
MSNINVDYVRFQNLNENGEISGETLGYKVYSEHGVYYDNFFQSFEELKEEVNKNTILEVISKIELFEDFDPNKKDFSLYSSVYLNGEEVWSDRE